MCSHVHSCIFWPVLPPDRNGVPSSGHPNLIPSHSLSKLMSTLPWERDWLLLVTLRNVSVLCREHLFLVLNKSAAASVAARRVYPTSPNRNGLLLRRVEKERHDIAWEIHVEQTTTPGCGFMCVCEREKDCVSPRSSGNVARSMTLEGGSIAHIERDIKSQGLERDGLMCASIYADCISWSWHSHLNAPCGREPLTSDI